MIASRVTQRLGLVLGLAASAPGHDELVRHVEAAIAEALARWPELAGATLDDAFVDAIGSRIDGEPDRVLAVRRLALPDLYLVAAVLDGQRGAMAPFERLVRDETGRAVTRLGTHAPAAEDVVQELLLKLLVPQGATPAKLVAFGGHGALHAWLRVAAVRTALNMTRRRREDPIEDAALAAVTDDTDDPSVAFLKSSYRLEFKRAFEATLIELPRRSRTLLRLQIIDQLTLEEISAFYQVSRATTARWLADARASLLTGTQRRLLAALAITTGELSELMQLVASSLYSTLPRLLQHTETRVNSPE